MGSSDSILAAIAGRADVIEVANALSKRFLPYRFLEQKLSQSVGRGMMIGESKTGGSIFQKDCKGKVAGGSDGSAFVIAKTTSYLCSFN